MKMYLLKQKLAMNIPVIDRQQVTKSIGLRLCYFRYPAVIAPVMVATRQMQVSMT